MKRVLIILAVLLGLVVIAALALPFFFNADSFRPRIEAELHTVLARDVKIGHISLSLMAGGITVENISVADDPAFSPNPFLQAKSLDVGVDLGKLIFSRELNVHSVTIVNPEVALIHNLAGTWNFASLGASSSASKPSAPKTASATPDLLVQKFRVVHGRVTVAAAGKKPVAYDDVTIDATNISFTTPIPFNVEAGTPGGGKMKVDGNAGPIDRADASRTPLRANVSITSMDLARTGFIPPESGIAAMVDYTGTVSSDGKVITSEGTAKAHDLKLVKTGTPARQPVSLNYASNYDVMKQAGTLTRGEVQTGGAVTRITGNYETRGDPVVHMKVTGQNLPIADLVNLLPALGVSLPAGSSLQGGTATANLAIDGALDKLVTTGTVDMANVKLANFNMGSKMSAIASLAGIHTGSDTAIQAFNSRLRVAPEGIRADSLTLIVPELGTVTGSGTMSSNNALNFRMAAKLNSNASVVGGLQKIAGLGQVNKPIPFRIEGTAQNPVFVPDIGGMIGNTVTAPAQGVENGIGSMLGGFLGKKKK